MRKILIYIVLAIFSAGMAACTGQSENKTSEANTETQQAANQSVVTNQQEQSGLQQAPPTLPPAGTGTANQTGQTQPQTTINQPKPNQNAAASQASSTGEILVGNEIGNDLGDFVNYSPDSVLIKLSSLRGKMVMVMLWNSLCHHCVVDNEKHKEIYNKYRDKNFKHGKGFDIYAIGLDKERSTWVQAIKEKKYPWKNNVYVIDSWKDRDVRFFGIKNLPGTFLIDQNGIVVNKLFTPEELDKILESYLVN